MRSLIFSSVLLTTFLFAPSAFADTVTGTCSGTVIVTIGADGADKMTAVNATFTMKATGKTSTFVLENKFAKPISGTGKQPASDDAPWALVAKDADGLAFKGQLQAVEGTYPGDTHQYAILDLKSTKVVISGPMSCIMK